MKKYNLFLLTLFLLISNIFLFHLDWQNSHKKLTFAMLDVGQGDGLFIESPTGTQVMFDGGPARSVLGPLARVMSPFDKSIDAIVITNPDADHIGGFLDILKNYKVGVVFESGALTDSKTYQNFKEEIKKQKIPNILAKRGMRLDIGGGAFIDVLFPDRDVSAWATNDGSVVARFTYGKTSIMLTGDAPIKTEKIILKENPAKELQSEILKVGHHGSRTSTSSEFVKAVSPSYALISDGKDNKFGHPHKETLDTLASFGVKIFRTDLLGTILLKCDTIKPCMINK
ncbi:MAG: ComEC/Rec2 family competence protein [Candidatus Nomurabacteria bacterium]|nr:ComEC/Rec2 family competence protein [Candidatus Nomurabacteria bacterium]